MKILKRLMNKTRRAGECLEYTGGIGSHGYGEFWMNGVSEKAHRASYLLNVGNIPKGKWILHTCDNKKCINPLHLYVGDIKQNTLDAISRGRMATGNRHGSKTNPDSFKRSNAKFSDAQCIEIKKSSLSKTKLALKHKTHLCTIYRAIYRADQLLKQLDQ